MKNFLLKTKEDLEGVAGMLILAAIAFSTSIGYLPSLMLALAGVIRMIAEFGYERPKILDTLSVMILLSLPTVNFMFGRGTKNALILFALVLTLTSLVRKRNETTERY